VGSEVSTEGSTASATIVLRYFTPARLAALVEFLNHVLAGHRHWSPITEADFVERVLVQPGFDPKGLVLAMQGEEVVGGVHAIKPSPSLPSHAEAEQRHHIAWLAVDPACREARLGSRLLGVAENYLYYCPAYFAAQSAPFYGIMERLWVPWYGSTERMGVSALNDKDLVAWLGRRGYLVVNPGDVSMAAGLHDRVRPKDPGLAEKDLRVVMINERAPWTGDEPVYRLRAWGFNGGRCYQGLVVADGERAVGSIVWYPLPDNETAALAWIGLERHYRGLRFGSFLLDRALTEMANRGYLKVEVHVHSKDHPEAFALFRRRGFQVIDYWVNLVKT
jgi:ribosomal protein S18 acetylase RimI-like enzyme